MVWLGPRDRLSVSPVLEEKPYMLRSSVIFSAVTLLVSPATAFPVGTSPAAPINQELLEVRLTKSNACKPKYKHKKAAQDLREKAHCK
jgi:hypothetical protein